MGKGTKCPQNLVFGRVKKLVEEKGNSPEVGKLSSEEQGMIKKGQRQTERLYHSVNFRTLNLHTSHIIKKKKHV